MRRVNLVVALSLSLPVHAGWFAQWCTRNLIVDDPYQFEHLSNDQVIDELVFYRRTGLTSEMLVREARKRLIEGMDPIQKEQMSKALVR